MLVDYLSDIHIDFWVKPDSPEYFQRKQISQFIKPFLPEKPSKVLIIPGDLGHDNDQILILFEVLLETYEHICFCEGNHDLYLIGQEAKARYKNDSFARLRELVDESSKIPGIHYLNGRLVEFEGKIIGGFPMWYDTSYGVEVCHRSPIFLHQLWKQYMADSKFIFIGGKESPGMDWREYCRSQKEILEANFRKCDLIFSHVSPDWSHLKPQYQDDPTSTFFHFDGREILKECSGKVWVYGHTHLSYQEWTNGCRMLCNPLGYPGEKGSYNERNIESFMIRTVQI